jgi:hypothetical protein
VFFPDLSWGIPPPERRAMPLPKTEAETLLQLENLNIAKSQPYTIGIMDKML